MRFPHNTVFYSIYICRNTLFFLIRMSTLTSASHQSSKQVLSSIKDTTLSDFLSLSHFVVSIFQRAYTLIVEIWDKDEHGPGVLLSLN